MSEPVIQVESLGKRYYIGRSQGRYRTLRDSLSDMATAPFKRGWHLLHGQSTGAADLHEALWALRDVSFEVQPGEVLGIIGRNGSGKSTLLKVLSRITEPTEGRARIRGRVGSLLEVGTGFHPELTGRDNIYLNGAILGMKREEIDRRFDEIVAFAEIDKFLDTPVKHYSSGMYVRLAFAVAAHMETDILLVDEVLSVGDLNFQNKCLNSMREFAQSERTVFFVSHNLSSIRRLCNRTLLLSEGKLLADGPTADVIEHYVELNDHAQGGAVSIREFPDSPDLPMQLRRVSISDSEGRSLNVYPTSTSLCVETVYEVREPVQSAYVMCAIVDQLGTDILWTYDAESEQFGNRRVGLFKTKVQLPPELLPSGRYHVRVVIVDTNVGVIHHPGSVVWFAVEDHDSLLAHRNIPWPGMTRLNPPWTTVELDGLDGGS